MALNFEEVSNFESLGAALKITSDKIEIVVLKDKGPRIVHLSAAGEKNMFGIVPQISSEHEDGQRWHLMGGHRLWHSPEAFPRSYMPDSHALECFEVKDDGVIMTQKTDDATYIQKAIEVRIADDRVKVTNILRNKGLWPIEMSVWSISVCATGGKGVFPVSQEDTGLLPNTHYVCWPYTRFCDARIGWGDKYVTVDSDPGAKKPMKIGYPCELGWMAYFHHDQCFVKKIPYLPDEKYPDNGCACETYSSDWGTEMEGLGPIKTVMPGEQIVLEEEWFVYGGIKRPGDEDEITQVLGGIASGAGIPLP